ncbi:DNA primase large subunit Spp2 [Umbelopsis sp. WA50703]
MSFGGQRTATPKFATKPAPPKRLHFGDDDDVDDEPKMEAVTGFEDNKVKRLHEPEKPKEIVIPSLPNKDFRQDAARKRAIYVPESGLTGKADAGSSGPEVLGQQVSQFGLQVTKKTAVTNEKGETDVHMEEMTTSIDNGPVEDQPKSLEETALAALIREAEGKGDEEEPSTLVIPNEIDIFRNDVASRPEETSLEEYEDVPVEQFGAALLRGMGWKEGQSLGGGKADVGPLAAKNFVRREALLGLGAKAEDIPAADKKNRRSAYEFSETNLFVKKPKDDGSRGSSRTGTPDPSSTDERRSERSSSRRARSRSRSPRHRDDRRDERSYKRSKRDRSRSTDRSRRRDYRDDDRGARRRDDYRRDDSRRHESRR